MAVIVVIGAGASHGCVSDSGSKKDPYKPPLTYDLFSSRDEFVKIQTKYSHVSDVASEIRANTSKKNSSSVEKYLRDKIYKSSSKYDNKAYFQIPLYLQELLYEFGSRYTNQPENYQALVSQLSRLDEKICYVTLNYDLLLDKVLNNKDLLSSMDSYISSDKNWHLYKLHGSVNWSFKANYMPDGSTLKDNFIGAFNKMSEENIDNGEYHYRNINSANINSIRFDSSPGSLYYPAVAVPIGSKDELVCPKEHINHLKKIISTEKLHLLMIGYSGNDEEVVSLLSNIDSKRISSVRIVSNTTSTAEAILEKLRLKIGFHPNKDNVVSGGFDQFIRGGNFVNYIEQIGLKSQT